LARFDFDESEDLSFPTDDVHFAVFGPIPGGHDAISQRSKIIDSQQLRPPAKREEPVK
jgi:hypothetical protein